MRKTVRFLFRQYKIALKKTYGSLNMKLKSDQINKHTI